MSKDDIIRMTAYAYRMAKEKGEETPSMLENSKMIKPTSFAQPLEWSMSIDHTQNEGWPSPKGIAKPNNQSLQSTNLEDGS